MSSASAVPTHPTAADKAAGDAANPDSLSMNPNRRKNLQENEPDVEPPLKNTTFGTFLTYLSLAVGLAAAFYTWRLTVWASDAGGYWNLLTGARPAPSDRLAKVAEAAASGAAAGGGSGAGGAGLGGADTPASKEDVESLVWKLAAALGVKPAELTAAIRPLVDPTVEHPTAAVAAAEAAAAAAEANAASNDQVEPSLLDVVGEVFLD